MKREVLLHGTDGDSLLQLFHEKQCHDECVHTDTRLGRFDHTDEHDREV